MPARSPGPLGSLNRYAQGLLEKHADVRCPRCHTKIPAEAIDIQRQLAKCPRCEALFDFARPNVVAPPKPRGGIAKPVGITVRDEVPDFDPFRPRGAPIPKGRRIIVRRWFTWGSLFLFVFAIVWNGVIALAWQNRPTAVVPIVVLGAFGIVTAYVAVCFLVNRTTIVLDPRRITVSHGPLPWFGDSSLAATNVEQVFCERETIGRQGRNPSYLVKAKLKSGERASLLSTLGDLEQARFIEQEIESYLEIADGHVDGEYRGG